MTQKSDYRQVHRSELPEHPAIQAWLTLGPDSKAPQRIEIIRPLTALIPVFRLIEASNCGGSVIAKQTNLADGLVETLFYEKVLPLLPVPKLHWHGSVQSSNGIVWLFVEDAGNSIISFHNARDQQIAVDWLACLHTTKPRLLSSLRLPDRGPDHYFERMSSSRSIIIELLELFEFSPDEKDLLSIIASQFDLLELHWNNVQSIFDYLPKGIVHGDFKEKNLRRLEQDNHMVAFDWENGGWGLPGIDMCRLDAEMYYKSIKKYLPEVTKTTISQLKELGQVFWCIDAIYWTLPWLEYQWRIRPMAKMLTYQQRLENAMLAIGLSR